MVADLVAKIFPLHAFKSDIILYLPNHQKNYKEKGIQK